MNPDYTHITLVIDRSGSMGTIREQSETGIRTLIQTHKEAPGIASLLLADFDAPEMYLKDSKWGRGDDWYVQRYLGDIKGFANYNLVPRNGTALYDAVARAIKDTGNYLKAMPEFTRPSKVIFGVMTDGEENSSRNVSLEALQSTIKHQTEVYKWEFTFLGAGLDVARQAMSMGFQASNITNFTPTAAGTSNAWTSYAGSTLNYRTTGVSSYAGKVEADGTVVEDADRETVTK